MSAAVKRKKMRDLIHSTLLKLEKNGENIIEYLYVLLHEFEDKKKNETDCKNLKRRKPTNHNHSRHKTMNNIAQNSKKHKKMKKKVNNEENSKKLKRRSNSLQPLHINDIINHNNKKHTKIKHKKANNTKKIYIDDEDEYIDKNMISMINDLNIPQNARSKMMEMDKSKKLLLIKQWHIAPKTSYHVRTKSDPLTPLTPSLTPSTTKLVKYPDVDDYKKDNNNNSKRNKSKKRGKSKSMAPIKRSKKEKENKNKKLIKKGNDSNDNKDKYRKRKFKSRKEISTHSNYVKEYDEEYYF